MQSRTLRRGAVVVSLLALAFAGAAPAADEDTGGIDPNQGRSLVEVHLDSKADAIALQLKADEYGIDFNDHYLRHDANGAVTVTVFGNAEELTRSRPPATSSARRSRVRPLAPQDRVADWQEEQQAERPRGARRGSVSDAARGRDRHPSCRPVRELRGPLPLGRGKARLARGSLGVPGASLALSWNNGPGTAIDRSPRAGREYRPRHDAGHLHRAPPARPDGGSGDDDAAAPTMIRIGSSTGASSRPP